MAGIGFELRRMIDEERGLVGRVRGYASAGLISSGPWVMTITTLALISAFGPLIANRAEYELFRGLVTYAFCFSLIVVGVLQMTVTRRVADLLYVRDHDRVLPGFHASAAVTVVVQIAVAVVFCVVAEFGPALSFVATSLYVIVSVTWLALIWLGVTREFDEIIRAYALGMVVTTAITLMLGTGSNAVAMLGAYTAGQALTLALLLRTIARGLDASGDRDMTILKSVTQFKRLLVVGLAYNAGIWIDKIVFWFADGTGPHPMVQFHPLYDSCCFLAYLTVIPALAVNLVRVETTFYDRYRDYYGSILGGLPLREIQACRRRMIETMTEGTIRLLRVQGALTVLIIVFAPDLMDLVGLPPAAVRIFRMTSLGALFHVLLLITILYQLYFELRVEASVTAIVFFGTNLILAAWSVDAGIQTYGLGYSMAALGSLVIGARLLQRGLARLDHATFTRQPLAV